MTHTYIITGMTCSSCKSKIEQLLYIVSGVKNVTVDLLKSTAEIEMAQHISISTFKKALKDYPKYQITEQYGPIPMYSGEQEPEVKSWFETYKPILIIFFYITAISTIGGFMGDQFYLGMGMRIFMAGFFITFSFFKMLDLKGFASSYAMYDIIAKKWNMWGYIYAFLELALGLAYAGDYLRGIINYVTLVVMSVSIIGVLQSVLNKRKIKCACLGAVFNLPMSTVTIIEDALMIAMSIAMMFIMS
jgi:copper chaperone CopZ